MNRGFRDLVRCSPRIQHKLGLYAAGLGPNLVVGSPSPTVSRLSKSTTRNGTNLILKLTDGGEDTDVQLSITGQRLVSMVDYRDPKTFQLNVWDWRTREHPLVHCVPTYSMHTKPCRNPPLGTSWHHGPHHQRPGVLGFSDDYRLATKVTPSSDGVPPRLLLLDAERVSSGVPVQTGFCGHWTWMVEAVGTSPFTPTPVSESLPCP